MESTIIPQQAGYEWASTDAEMFETSARRMISRGVPMGEKEAEGVDLERLCQGVSPNDEPCDYPATVHCARCGRWFCDAHAEEEEWHSCMLPPGEEGGEA